MNVATTTAAPQSLPVNADAASAATRVVLGPDGGSVDTPVDSAATFGEDFGRLLSRGLMGFDAADAAVPGTVAKMPADTLDRRPDAKSSDLKALDDANLKAFDGKATNLKAFDATAVDAEATDPSQPATAGRFGFGSRVGTADGVAIDRSLRATKAGDDDAAVTASGSSQHDDAAANDLAAQLALVSQWTGIAKTPMPQDAGGSDASAIRDKLDIVRGGSTKEARSASQTGVAGANADTQPSSFAVATRQGTPIALRADGPSASSVDNAKADKASRDEAASSIAVARPSLAEGVFAQAAADARQAPEVATAPSSALASLVAAHGTGSGAPITTSVMAAPTWAIQEPVGTPAWSHEVGQATLRLAANDLQSASLQLNPEHLGPVDVQVRIDNGTAHLSFNAAHADTRQAIEASRTTLDQLFSDQGLKIGDCAVGDSSTSRRGFDGDASAAGQSQRGDGGSRQDQRTGTDATSDAGTATITTRVKVPGLVDTFA